MRLDNIFLAAVLAVAGLGCSSSSDTGSGAPGGDDGSPPASDDGSTPDDVASPVDGAAPDGGVPAEAGTGHDGGDAGAVNPDAGADAASTGHDGGSATGGDAAADSGASGGAAAGKAGVDAYCTAVCSHEHDCAASLDAGTVDIAACMSTCQTTYEGPNATTKSEIFRADYVAALGSCFASAACADVISGTASSKCADSVLTTSPVSAQVGTFCRDYSTSACNFTALPSCDTTFGFFSDAVVQALVACVSGSLPCTSDGGANQVTCINSTVNTQP
jgi:hypothetical protein